MLRRLTRSLIYFAVLMTIAATSTGCTGKKIPMKSFYSANDCAISEQTVKWIENQKQLDNVMKKTSLFSSNDRMPTAGINFERENLILVAMGNKPTAGYVIAWSNDPATLENGDLHLPVELRNPPAGTMQAQIVTSPCRIFSIPKTGFQRIKLRPIQDGT